MPQLFKANFTPHKGVLVGVVIATVVLQLISPAIFNLPAQAVEPTPVWPTSWTTPNTCTIDPSDESPKEADILGDATNPAVGFAFDTNFQYFRERLEGNPSKKNPPQVGNLKNSAWVVLFQITAPQYQYLAAVDGDHNKVQLWQNSTPSGPIDFSQVFHDQAETKLWERNSTDYARIVGSGGAYYMDWAIPLSELTSRGITINTTKYFATSQTSSNYNKDYLNCYQAITDLSVTKIDSADPVDVGDNFTYTITVTNNGPENAVSVEVTDNLPSGVTYISSSTLTGSYDNSTGIWTIGNLNNGSSATLDITVSVNSQSGGTTLSNTATVSSSTTEANESNNSVTETTLVNEVIVPTENTLELCSDSLDNDKDSLVDLDDPDCLEFIPTITLVKEVTNDNGGEAVPSDFTLKVGSTEVSSGDITEVDPNVPIEINELSLTGYGFVSITGDEQCPVELGGTATLTIGDHITCTITNDDQPGSITLTKGVNNNHGGTLGPNDFGLFVDDADVTSGIPRIVNAGWHYIGELIKPGYSFTGISGNGCPQTLEPDNGRLFGSLFVGLGQEITCTITNNDQAATLIVTKQVFNQEGGQLTASPADFTMQVFGTNVSPGSFPGDESGTTVTLDAGSYSVTEEGPEGYNNTSMSDGCSGTIAVGETKQCLIVNTSYEVTLGRIIVDKVTNPEADQQYFNFNLTGDQYNSDFSLSDVSKPYDTGFIEPGTYVLSEVVPEGWQLDTIHCVGGDYTYDPSSISLAAGKIVICTATNTKLGKIIVSKVTDPTGSQQSFDFTTSYSEPFSLLDGEQNESSYLTPAIYSVSESLLEGWELTQVMCSGAITGIPSAWYAPYVPGDPLELNPGEIITCTFTNTYIPPGPEYGAIHGYKWNDEDGNGERGEEELLAGWTIFLDENDNGILDREEVSTQTDDGDYYGWYWFNFLPYRTYRVCEVAQTGWVQTYPASCHSVILPDGNPQSFPATPNAIIGPEYNFGNHYITKADLEITKTVDDTTPDVGQNIVYTITVYNSGPDEATSVVVTDNLPVGVTYVSHSASQGSYSNNTGLWEVGTLEDEQSATLTITVTVNSGTGGQTIVNSVAATSEQTDPNQENSSDSQSVNVNSQVVITGGGGGGGGVAPGLYIHTEQVGDTATTSATITWFTNLAATSRVVYDTVSRPIVGFLPNLGYSFSNTEDTTLTTFHSMVISGLLANTTYYFRPVSANVTNTVNGIELMIKTGEVAGAYTEQEPAGSSEPTTGGNTGTDSGKQGSGPTGVVLGEQTRILAQGEPEPELITEPEPEPELFDEQPITVPEITTESEPVNCNSTIWLFIILNLIAAALLWNKYKNSQAVWKKYLWLVNLILTIVPTIIWYSNCTLWSWLLMVLIFSLLFLRPFGGKKETTTSI